MRGRKGKKVILIGRRENLVFDSLTSASRFLKVSTPTVSEYIEKNQSKNGYFIDFLLEGK